MKKGLNNYIHKIHSQNGEDGIILEIFKRLEIKEGFCVEFGAGDGISGSNTLHFTRDLNFKGLLIENSDAEFQKLKNNAQNFPNASILKCAVSHEGEFKLDNILSKFNIKEDFDLVSIDVDGNDYFIWDSMKDYKPKCVIIEFAASMPPHFEFIDKSHQFQGPGSSALSIIKLAHLKEYSLVGCTGCNLIFVRNDFFNSLNIDEACVRDIFPYGCLCFIISQPNGNLFIDKARPVHRHFRGENSRTGYPPPDKNGLWPITLTRR